MKKVETNLLNFIYKPPMNKKLLIIPISIILPLFLNAQSSVQNSQSQLAISGVPTISLSNGKVAIVETPVQARRQLLKNLKGLQVLNGDMSFDNLDFNNADAYKEYIILTKEGKLFADGIAADLFF